MHQALENYSIVLTINAFDHPDVSFPFVICTCTEQMPAVVHIHATDESGDQALTRLPKRSENRKRMSSGKPG